MESARSVVADGGREGEPPKPVSIALVRVDAEEEGVHTETNALTDDWPGQEGEHTETDALTDDGLGQEPVRQCTNVCCLLLSLLVCGLTMPGLFVSADFLDIMVQKETANALLQTFGQLAGIVNVSEGNSTRLLCSGTLPWLYICPDELVSDQKFVDSRDHRTNLALNATTSGLQGLSAKPVMLSGASSTFGTVSSALVDATQDTVDIEWAVCVQSCPPLPPRVCKNNNEENYPSQVNPKSPLDHVCWPTNSDKVSIIEENLKNGHWTRSVGIALLASYLHMGLRDYLLALACMLLSARMASWFLWLFKTCMGKLTLTAVMVAVVYCNFMGYIFLSQGATSIVNRAMGFSYIGMGLAIFFATYYVWCGLPDNMTVAKTCFELAMECYTYCPQIQRAGYWSALFQGPATVFMFGGWLVMLAPLVAHDPERGARWLLALRLLVFQFFWGWQASLFFNIESFIIAYLTEEWYMIKIMKPATGVFKFFWEQGDEEEEVSRTYLGGLATVLRYHMGSMFLASFVSTWNRILYTIVSLPHFIIHNCLHRSGSQGDWWHAWGRCSRSVGWSYIAMVLDGQSFMTSATAVKHVLTMKLFSEHQKKGEGKKCIGTLSVLHRAFWVCCLLSVAGITGIVGSLGTVAFAWLHGQNPVLQSMQSFEGVASSAERLRLFHFTLMCSILSILSALMSCSVLLVVGIISDTLIFNFAVTEDQQGQLPSAMFPSRTQRMSCGWLLGDDPEHTRLPLFAPRPSINPLSLQKFPLTFETLYVIAGAARLAGAIPTANAAPF